MTSTNKRQKSILLIPVQDNLSHLGVKYLHYTLLENGFNSRILFLPHFKINDSVHLKNLQEFISQMDPLYVGLSFTSLDYYSARELATFLKKTFPALPIICGGIHATVDPESCISFTDYVMIGEGEKAILDFSNALTNGTDIKEVPNLCYQENGQLIKTPLLLLFRILTACQCLIIFPNTATYKEKMAKFM